MSIAVVIAFDRGLWFYGQMLVTLLPALFLSTLLLAMYV